MGSRAAQAPVGRMSLKVKLRRLSLGYKSLLDPHSRTLRNLYRWAFSFHLRICAYQAAGPVRNPEQPELSPPRSWINAVFPCCDRPP